MATAYATRVSRGVEVGSTPFPYYIYDGFRKVTTRLKRESWRPPPPDWDGWEAHYRDCYQNGKRTTRHINRLPLTLRYVFSSLAHGEARQMWGYLFGLPPLENDPLLHGGGLHVMPPGSRLGCHLDYAVHPKQPNKERRLSVIVFLNTEWREEWGGALCLCNPLGDVAKRIYPAPGRVVAWEASDRSYHAVEPITGPVERVTAAVYYLTDARPEAVRQRALFIPEKM